MKTSIWASRFFALAALAVAVGCDERSKGGVAPPEVVTWTPEHPGVGTDAGLRDAGPDFRDASVRPPRDASVDFADGGEAIFNPPPPHIDAVDPATGPTTGGTAIRVTGEGFVTGTIVSIAGQTAMSQVVVDEQTVTAVTPPGTAGAAEVRVAGPYGAAWKSDGFAYETKVRVAGISPVSGPAVGGTTVTVTGEGFRAGATVKFGATAVTASAVAANGTSVTAVTPPGAVGAVDVEVASPGGDRDTLPAAYAYFDDAAVTFAVTAITPGFGPAAGGNLVTISGGGFDAAAGADGGTALAVSIGGSDCAGATVVDTHTIRCTAPAHAAGSVDVVLANGANVATLAQAYRFVRPIAVSSVTPNRGPAAGGTAVVVAGSGFSDVATVKWGAATASFSVVDDATINVTTPPGAGRVAVTVESRFARGAMADAFTYEAAPVVLWVEPNRGSVAGGTFVAVSGQGFDSATSVTLGGTALVAQQFVGPSLITGKTPPGPVGTVGAFATSPNGTSNMRNAFTYYDPFRPYGGNGGGPVVGAVNVTVLNGGDGTRVDGAFVMLRTAATTPYKGTTDARGQVTLSGLDVLGVQVVTASKAGFAASTVNAVNAADVVIILEPLPTPQPGSPPPLPIGTISGRVQSFGKEVPDPRNAFEHKAVFVQTTQRNIFRSNPNPGPRGSTVDMTNSPTPLSFDYQITSRTGDVAVLAVAGLLDSRDPDAGGVGFTPFVMGVHRYLFVGDAQTLTNINVDMNHRLLTSATFRMVDPPPLAPAGPTEYHVIPYLDFGGEGVFRWTDGTGAGPDFVMDKFPDRVGDLAGLPYLVWAGAFNDGYVPYSYWFLWTLNDITARVDIGPMVDIPQASTPQPGDAPVGRRFAWTSAGPTPSFHYAVVLKPAVPAPIAVWTIQQPGGVKEFTLPDLTGAGGPSPLEVTVPSYYWAVVPYLRDTFNFNDFTLDQLNITEMKGFAANVWTFSNR